MSKKDTYSIVFYYNKPNRNSFNALLGAIENHPVIHKIPIFLFTTKEELLTHIGSIAVNSKAVIACFSFFTTQVFEIEGLVTHIKKMAIDNIITVAGGAHPTGVPVDVLYMGFDLVVSGEGEEILINIIKTIVEEESLEDIPGIWYINECGEVSSNKQRSPIILDRYPSIAERHRLFGPIEITRGCPHSCTFCQIPYMGGNGTVRHRSVGNICVQIESMRKAGLKDFTFVSPNALSYGSEDGKSVAYETLEHLLTEVKKTAGESGNIFLGSFPSEVRPELVTHESCALLSSYVDNKKLVIGAQSGSERLLKCCRRNHTVSDIYTATEAAISAGFEPQLDFLFCVPGETEKDNEHSMKVIGELVQMGATIHAHTYIPLPCTPNADEQLPYINPKVKQFLRSLTGKGSLYGQWETQEAEAHTIDHYLKKKQCPF
jgi:B12-binding domain/radical SAM domain protein